MAYDGGGSKAASKILVLRTPPLHLVAVVLSVVLVLMVAPRQECPCPAPAPATIHVGTTVSSLPLLPLTLKTVLQGQQP